MQEVKDECYRVLFVNIFIGKCICANSLFSFSKKNGHLARVHHGNGRNDIRTSVRLYSGNTFLDRMGSFSAWNIVNNLRTCEKNFLAKLDE